jgi:hypothetical protein
MDMNAKPGISNGWRTPVNLHLRERKKKKKTS